MKNFSYLIVIIIIFAFLFTVKFINENIIFKRLKSNVDDNYYFVLNTTNSQDAADYLGRLNKDITYLLKYLESNDNYKRYGILEEHLISFKKRYNHSILSEANLSKDYTSYTFAKTFVYLCIRHKPNTLSFVNYNTALYVLIHEISHLICDSYVKEKEHYSNKEYISTFNGLLAASYDLGILKQVNYSKMPESYCGIVIS
jgi:hypothetical protein